jgi:hypothetical protein
VTPQNDLFVLDLWARQGQESELVKAVFAMADKWRCPTVHPETIRQGVSLYNALTSIVSTRAKDMAGVEHLPKIAKLNPGIAEKQDKIAGLQFRFEHGKIKLPLWRRDQVPWRILFDQIESFNPEAQDGGLEKDDWPPLQGPRCRGHQDAVRAPAGRQLLRGRDPHRRGPRHQPADRRTDPRDPRCTNPRYTTDPLLQDLRPGSRSRCSRRWPGGTSGVAPRRSRQVREARIGRSQFPMLG